MRHVLRKAVSLASFRCRFNQVRFCHSRQPLTALANIDVVSIAPSQFSEYSDQLLKLDQDFTYPLGEDSFKIDHGSQYFSFFQRLGIQPFVYPRLMSQVIKFGTPWPLTNTPKQWLVLVVVFSGTFTFFKLLLLLQKLGTFVISKSSQIIVEIGYPLE